MDDHSSKEIKSHSGRSANLYKKKIRGGIKMEIKLEKVKQNLVGLVDHLPVHYQLEFAAYLLEQFQLQSCSQFIWEIMKDPLFAPEIFKTKVFLVHNGESEEIFVQYLINTASTLTKIFDKDVIIFFAMEIIRSAALQNSLKDPLIKKMEQHLGISPKTTDCST